MAWIYLGLAGLLEVVWAIGLKQSEGFTRLWPSLWTLVAMAASFWLLALALRALPLGTAYAIWTGIGAFGTAMVGILAFGETTTALRLLFLGLLIACIMNGMTIPLGEKSDAPVAYSWMALVHMLLFVVLATGLGVFAILLTARMTNAESSPLSVLAMRSRPPR